MMIKEVKNKISIISNINKLTNTMSMISLSKINKYFKYLDILNKLFIECKILYSHIINLKNKKNFCCVILTTNKGLCGSLNQDILKKSLNFVKNNNFNIFLIGKKGIEYFKKKKIFFKKIFIENEKVFKINLTKKLLKELSLYKNIFFFSYKYYNNSIKIVITKLIDKIFFCDFNIIKFNSINFLYKFLNIFFKKICLENFLCELRSRMIIMKLAADNSNKIIKKMKIIKNKVRQNKVTRELLEVVNNIFI